MAPKPRRRTIRFAIVAVVCLLLGFATTTGIAWAIASGLLPEPFGGFVISRFGAEAGWPAVAAADWPPPTSGLRTTRVFSTQEYYASYTPLADGANENRGPTDAEGVRRVTVDLRSSHSMMLKHVGWPWRACTWIERSAHGVTIGGPAPSSISWTILFAGFAADTALYAAAWYLLLFTPLPLYRAGRRRFRVSRGMCPACAYDLKGSPSGPCPECGPLGGARL